MWSQTLNHNFGNEFPYLEQLNKVIVSEHPKEKYAFCNRKREAALSATRRNVQGGACKCVQRVRATGVRMRVQCACMCVHVCDPHLLLVSVAIHLAVCDLHWPHVND